MTKPTDPNDKRAAVAFLSAYANQMDDLITILSRGRSMSRTHKSKITEMYRTLKNGLKEDCKRLSRKESQGEATHIEIAFLLPAVYKASVKLRPATNTNPFNSHWFDVVYNAKIDIDFFLGQLKE